MTRREIIKRVLPSAFIMPLSSIKKFVGMIESRA